MEEEALDNSVKKMLAAGAIYQNDAKNLVLSSIYTIMKKGTDDRRPVVNLRWVNDHLHTNHFKMTTMKDVKAAITRDCFMAKVDLKDCFWQMPVAKKHQRFLSFHWKGKNYSFRCLPFGLSIAPLIITKLYKPVIAHLQRRGFTVMIYIDDILILGKSKEECHRAVSETLETLSRLGVMVNDRKSSLLPTQVVEYLGFEIDSTQITIKAPDCKIKNLRKELGRMSNKEAVSSRDLASILGKINAMADALFPTRVHTTELHCQKVKMLQKFGDWDKQVPLNKKAQEELKWWKENIKEMNGTSLIPQTPDLLAGTDASDTGWGAWVNGATQRMEFGGFSRRKKAKSISITKKC